MGGKSKQSQRTKNNARPSSSGRSAELLSSANLDPTMGGKMMPLFPTFTSPAIEHGLTPEFSVCIKKLNKKDPVTKSKALQELTDLVNNSKVDDVVTALPSWAHFYKILAVDTDCKVREAAQACHASFARACGRRLAPLLRQVVPAWLQAQYDDHAPAQAHAHNSLAATFPESKLPEVISFCKAEVVMHFLENITGSGDKVIMNRIESPEERELQQQRLISSSLQGLRFLAKHMPPAHHDWLWTALEPLFASQAFWKYPSHTSAQIRASWFGALGAVIERFGGTFGAAFGSRSTRILLAGAHERQPVVAHQLWGCLLSLCYSVPDWHKWLDKKELLIKRILEMLEKVFAFLQGGWGDARRLSDMLLPLLAHLPPDLLTKGFHEDFFNALYQGLDKKNILSSKSERQYWITSLSECLRYLSIQQHDYVLEVATSAHRTWLEKVLNPENDPQLRNNLVKHSATSMASLVRYWLKQSKEANDEKYDQLVRNFWQNVASTVLLQIDESSKEADKIVHIIEGHILLLQTLKTAFLSESKKPQSIKFHGDAPNEAEVKTVPVQEIDTASIERYKHNLNDVVEKIVCGYFEFANKIDLCEPVLTPLITILNDFDSKHLYVALASHFDANGVYELYDKLLRAWMLTDTMRCKAIVDVIFILMKHLTEVEQDAVLASFDQFPCGALEWCVSAAVCHLQWRCASVRRWLRGRTVREVMLALSRRLLRQRCAKARNLLFVCLSRDACETNEMLISEETASKIAEVVSTALCESLEPSTSESSQEDFDLEHAASIAAHLATALASRNPDDNYLQLILNLFKLTVYVPRGSPRLSPSAWLEVRGAAHDGLVALPLEARKLARARAAAVLHQTLLNLVDTVSITQIEHMTSLCPYLLSECDDSVPPTDVSEIVEFSKQILDFAAPTPSTPVEAFALRYDCISNKLNCPFEDDTELIKAIVAEASKDSPAELTKKNLVPYANKFLFRAIYFRTMLLHRGANEDEEDEEQQKENEAWCNNLMRDEYFQEQFCDLLRESMVVNSLHEGYGYWLHHTLIQQTKSKLDTIIDAIISETAEDIKTSILTSLSERAATDGYYWSYARKFYETKIEKDGDSGEGDKSVSLTEDLDVTELEKVLTGNGFFHSLQANTANSPNSRAALQCKFAVMMRSVLATCPNAATDSNFAADALAACSSCNLDSIIDFYHRNNDRMFVERDISSMSWGEVVTESSIVDCVIAALSQDGWNAAPHHWDFATVSLCTLVDCVSQAHEHYGCTKVAMLSLATFRLYSFVEQFVREIRAESERRQPLPHVFDLTAEWKDVFAPTLNNHIYSIAVHLLKNGTAKISSGQARLLSGVAMAIQQADWSLIDSAHRNHSLALPTLVDCAASALASPLHPAYHCLAYRTLISLAGPLAQYDAEQLAIWSAEGTEEGEDRARPHLAPEWFHPHFARALELADAALTGHNAGVDSCEMVAGSDAHALALGCLLLADPLHELTTRARGDLAHHYIHHYRENHYTESLLPTALRLIPSELLNAASPPPHYATHFYSIPDWAADDGRWWRSIGVVSCRGIYSCVGGAGGGGARGWWGAAGRAGRALARLVAAYVAPPLIRRQLEHFLARKGELEDCEVTVHWTTNEAITVYRIEDRPIELWIRFEPEFPLALPRVTAPTVRPAVSTNWIAMYIAYQNGTILNAVKMWCLAISSHVESSPQCYVCYCRLHPTTGHLPQVRCHQCRNRFHTACIHKWFVSSHKSNCPLCRSNF